MNASMLSIRMKSLNNKLLRKNTLIIKYRGINNANTQYVQYARRILLFLNNCIVERWNISLVSTIHILQPRHEGGFLKPNDQICFV